jgi:predicted aspartyl protease
MIRGVVNARNEAVVRIRVRGPAHSGLDLDAIVDTGFTESLTLSAATIASLGLTRKMIGGAVLADGSAQRFDVYPAEISWDGGWRPILVYAIGAVPLLGMRLLVGNALRIAVVPGGTVVIVPLP